MRESYLALDGVCFEFFSPTSKSKAFVHPNHFRFPAGMVDHSNPVAIAQDSGTCIVHELGIQRTCWSFNSSDGEVLARHIWFVHVRLPCCPASVYVLPGFT